MNAVFSAKSNPGIERPVCVESIEEGNIAGPSSSGVENSRFKRFSSLKGISVYSILKKGAEDDFAFPREHIHAGLRLPERIIKEMDKFKFSLGTYLEWMEKSESNAQLEEISETYSVKIKQFTNKNFGKLWSAVIKFDDLVNRPIWQEEFLKKENFYSYLCENKKKPRLGYDWLESICSEMKKDNEFSFLCGLWAEISIMTALEVSCYDTAGGNIYFDWEAFDKEIDIHSSGTPLLKEPDLGRVLNKRKDNMPSTSEPVEKKVKTDSVDMNPCVGVKGLCRQEDVGVGESDPQPDIGEEGMNTQYNNRLLGRSLSKEVKASIELLDEDLYLSDDSDCDLSEDDEGITNS